MKKIRNPIIPGFYPDPTICRVGEDYYLACSSFELCPGIPIFHSRDLVHWEQICNAMTPQNGFHVEKNCMDGGVMAPTFRYCDGIFYIINANFSDKGNYIVTAKDPAGPWSEPGCGADAVAEGQTTDISSGWTLALAPCGSLIYSPVGVQQKLLPVSLADPLFSGTMRYEKSVVLAAPAERVVFRAEYIYESAELFVNGVSAGKLLTPEYQWEITELCREGENTFCVIVANTPTRDPLKYPGIFGPEREVTEPSGMFGRLELLSY